MRTTLLTLFILLSFGLTAQNNYNVLLHTGTQEFPENARDYAENATIAASEIIDGQYYRLLQFYELPNQAGLAAIENQGIELLEYIPNKTYLAAIPASFDLEKLTQLNVRSIVELTTDLKVAIDLKMDNLPNWAMHRQQVEVMVKYHKNLRQADVLTYCASDNIKVLKANGVNNFLLASINKNEIEDLANLPYIAFLELRPAPDVKDDIEGRSLHRANVIDTNFPTGRSYTGEGISVLTRDDGAVGPHIDFTGRISQDESNGFGGTHGDGVSGLFAGAGNLNPRNRGMAAGADLYVIDYEATFLDNTMDLFFDENVIVTNSSYSNGCNDGYTSTTETVDQQIYDNPTLLHVFSAGNSNNNECGYGAGDQWGNITGGHKQGKNVIATANLNSDGTLVASSSRGPAHDGRIKPDIAANGRNQISTDPDNTYSPFGGTSAAAPCIAGITAMLHNAYAELNGGETANSALLKAVLLNTANDLGTVGPDYQFGWGHVNAYRAALTLEGNQYFTSTIEAGTPNNHMIDIPENVAQARVMVYWADQPSSVMTTKALVNDLNIHMSGIDAVVHSPWVRDPTPDSTILAMPATTGIDDLNNMEQVAIANPEAGPYTLTVDGFELPFGAHDYIVVWEFRMADEITVIYPIGGENLNPTEFERIHWDAASTGEDFTLEYSTDNGASWNFIANAAGDIRMYDWTVPTELTAQALVRVSRGQVVNDISDATFSIAPMTDEVTLLQLCPDYMRVTWNQIEDATSYDIYLLGQKYMEVALNSTDFFVDIPITDPTQIYWVAVDVNFANGAKSRRTNAIQVGGTLDNCAQEVDMLNNSILAPTSDFASFCLDAFAGMVEISVANNGINTQNSVNVGYQMNGNPVVVETLDEAIEPGEVVQYIFQTPYEITESGLVNLTTWVSSIGESSPMDDTLRSEISIFLGGGTQPDITETFEGADFPKQYWLIENPDESLTWQEESVIGPNGNFTDVVSMNFYSYNSAGEEDYFVMEPLDFTNATEELALTFDIAYTFYDADLQDGLRIELSTDCGATYDNIIYDKDGEDLATVPGMLGAFIPTSTEDWRNETVDLSAFVGMDKIRIRFVAETGYGNNLYIDNINVLGGSVVLVPPVAGFETSPVDQYCRNQPITFTSTSTGEINNYSWDFGDGAFPPNAMGEGPHQVNYLIGASDKIVQLTVSNDQGEDVFMTQIFVDDVPTGNFDFTIGNDGEVVFNSTIDNANSIAWDFSNNQNSDDPNPTILFEEAGVYEVSLTLSNGCGDEVITQEVEVLSTAAIEQLNDLQLRIFPNPNNGAFALLIENAQGNQLSLELSDLRGVLIQTVELTNLSGTVEYNFDKTALTAGVYFLKIKEADSFVVKKVVVE